MELIEIDNIIIQKADKGNVIVIIDKTTYFSKMNSILNDDTKFEKVNFSKRNKELDYILDKQEKITNFLKELKDSNVITKTVFENLKPSGTQPGVLYGLCKVHKGISAEGESPPFSSNTVSNKYPFI